MKDRSEPDRLRNALLKALILAAFAILMLAVEGQTILGLIALGAAGLLFVAQYLIPLRRQQTADRDPSDSER